MLDYSQLEALLAIDDEGTIEGAARALRVSSFAVSQRVSQLEKSVGVMLVERGPTRTSDAGRVLCDHARQVKGLEDDLLQAHCNGTFLNDKDEPPTLRISLTEEAISGWFRHVLKDWLDTETLMRIDVTTANPNRSIELMQSGEVVAGISTAKDPINGFKVYRLGDARYLAVASPSFIQTYFAEGVTEASLATAPCLRHCQYDGLASAWVEDRFPKPPVLPLYKLPDMKGVLKAVLSGDAWTMIEQGEAGPHVQGGRLAELLADSTLIQPLYWHVAIAMLDIMADITRMVRKYAN